MARVNKNSEKKGFKVMAMTNEQIIMQEKILRNINGEIHTFEHWKALGFKVKKGEKSDIKFAIWKYSKGKTIENDEGEKEEKRPHCFMKMSAFFTENQVEPIKAG